MIKNATPYPVSKGAQDAADLQAGKEIKKVVTQYASKGAMEAAGLIEKSDYQTLKNKQVVADKIARMTPAQIKSKEEQVKLDEIGLGIEKLKMKIAQDQKDIADWQADIEAYESKRK